MATLEPKVKAEMVSSRTSWNGIDYQKDYRMDYGRHAAIELQAAFLRLMQTQGHHQSPSLLLLFVFPLKCFRMSQHLLFLQASQMGVQSL